jgi:hypothetical protein
MTVSINGTSGLVFNDASTQNTAATGFGFKNRIINGAMMIDQRNAGASVTVSDAYTLDRWSVYENTTGTFTVQQSTVTPSGFRNSLLVTVTGTASSLGTNIALIRQYVEGFNCSDLMWGTANAQSVTLSFWVRSSVTGTFTGVIQNANNDRAYAFSYTISASNTWEQKTVSLAGDTTGTWVTNNGRGIELDFSLASATGLTADTWQANGTGGNYYYAATGQTNLMATSGATFYITGVQLEKGSTATSFDYRPYGTELALCQRYYYRINASSTTFQAIGLGYQMSSQTTSQMTVIPKVTMRAAPSLGYNNLIVTDYTSWSGSVSSISGAYGSSDFIQMQLTHVSGGASYRPASLQPSSSTGSYFDMSAEL